MKYPTYSQTTLHPHVPWIGELPSHWRLLRGRFIMQVNPATPRVRELEPEVEVSFVPMEAVGERGGLALDQTRVLAEISAGYTAFQDGDVIVAKITPCFENGKGALACDLLNGMAFGTTELHVLRSGETLDNRFLFYLTLSDPFRKLGEAEMYGAGGQKRVPPEFNKDFQVPLPPLAEQHLVTNFLDWKMGQIDALIAKKTDLVEKLKEKRTAVITQAVTKGLSTNAPMRESGMDWIGRVPDHWVINRAKYVCEAIVDCKNRTPEYFDDGEFFVVRTTDVKNGVLNLEEALTTDFDNFIEWTLRGAPQRNDVLFTREAPAGEAALFDGMAQICMGQRMMYFRVDPGKLHPKYLLYYIYSKSMRTYIDSESGGSTVSHLRLGQVYNLPILQPLIMEQLEIVDYLDSTTAKIDLMIRNAQSVIASLTEYRTALITAATTGKIDVRQVKLGSAV